MFLKKSLVNTNSLCLLISYDHYNIEKKIVNIHFGAKGGITMTSDELKKEFPLLQNRKET